MSALLLFSATPIAMAYIPPAFAASIPASESSITTHSDGAIPNFLAAIRNTSGSGFDF